MSRARSLWEQGHAAVDRLDEAVLSVRDGLTAGQRWTASLAMALSALVLLYGLPHRVMTSGAAPAASPPSVAASRAASLQPAPSTVPSAVPVAGYPPPVLAVAVKSPAVSPTLTATPLPVSPPAPVRGFVALVRVGDPPEPGRDDASIAKVFLAHGGFPATIITLDTTNPHLCADVLAEGNVVLAGAGLDPLLRDCLVGRGAVVIAFDGLGDLPPSSAAGGQVLSTRRGLSDSLLDLARWGLFSGYLHGRAGLVMASSARASTTEVAAAMRALGVNVVAIAYVEDDPTSSSVTDGVRAFSAAGVDVAVLAAPAAVQSRWVAVADVLDSGVGYVVADGFDAIGNGQYPPSFDGSLAHTSLRVPWYARAHGQTAAQSACLNAWDATVTPAQTLSNDEESDVFAWCEQVTLVSAALGAAGQAGSFASALRALRLASPLTSDLGPLGHSEWGPTQDGVLAWSAACACWQEKTPFTDRRSS